MPWAQPKDVSIKIQNMDTLFRYVHSMDTFTKEYSCIHQIRKQEYALEKQQQITLKLCK